MRLLLVVAFAAPLAAQTPEQLYRDRKFPEARAAAQAMLVANKNDASAMYWIGRVADAEGKNAEAMDWYEKAVKRDDKNALYHYWLGTAVGDEAQNANKLRQPFLARKVKAAFERAVELDPKMLDPRFGLVDFYSMAPAFMGGGMDKARAQAAEILKLNPMRGHLAYARIANRERNVAAEEKALQDAIAAAPDSANPYYSLASFYRRLNRWDDAFGAYDRLMQARPNEVVAHLGWGAVSALSGRSYDRGERELKLFLTRANPDSVGAINMAGAHFRLAQIYEKTSRPELAKASYGETLRINPQHADARKGLAALK